MTRSILSIASMICFSAQSLAQVPSPVEEVLVPAPPFQERIDPNILSAGGLVVGLVTGDITRAVGDPVVTVSGIRPADKFLCVALQHVAGAYSGGFTVKNPGRGATVRFRIPTRHIPGLGARTGALAILAKAGSDARCSEQGAVILPAAWGRVQPGTSAYALVNDHQADVTLVRLDKNPARRCVALSQLFDAKLALRSYQVACPVDLSGPCASEAPLVVKFLDGASVSEVRPTIRRGC